VRCYDQGVTGFNSREPHMGIFWRLIRYLQGLIARYNVVVDHSEAWKQRKLGPRPKWENEIASE
jgi:hypothetical protein